MRRVILLLKPLLLLGILAASGCDRQTQQANSVEQIQQRGSLRVGTLYHPLYYFLRDGQEEGLDFELAYQFSASLGDNIALQMVPAYSIDELFALLDNGHVDMLAAGLVNTKQRRQLYRFGPSYYHIEHTLAYRKGTARPKRIQDLTNGITVLAGSSQAEWLYEQQQIHPELFWQAQRDSDAEDLLRQVAEKKTEYALVNDILLARTQRYYPSIEAAFTVGKPQAIAWMLPKNRDDSLLGPMLSFFEQQSSNGTLARLHEKYFGHVQSFDYVDTRTFLQRIDNRLPQYQPLFERYAGELDWRLLAAMSYQESHWDPKATSYTGVRGMMMLTEDTAAQVGVTNRLDPEQSIRGGAQYLTSILARLPASIPDGERIWFALAAYNIGLGHVLDVRRLTQSRQQDPNSWAQVKENLPLLHQPKWYRQTRYGYARGRETKQFVNNIRQYYQSLLWQDYAQADTNLRIQHEAPTVETDI
ncbi:membrane-bound lytic murein transglycosylase MltF [Oceanisphaera pacifica]|uniref:Membrane-bound lytic murein transglycosylase F n=1 Tax=Oceanisphaera pacifica TaxID=2818389 RepID=A0ABS3NDH1_9GAMM|nr:membrane-bound lytic murein transglycosylase MltF [Oceanisphaera pacifica]MBO1518517.1 membrane-bound lytic murein transglycosylase MltF [Oceanisphaera pacifica]